MTLPDATRLGSEAGSSPRSEFHTYFWVSVSQLQALRWGAGGRAKEAKVGLAQAYDRAGQGPSTQFSLSLTEAEGRGRKTWRTFRKPLGSWVYFPSSSSLPLTAGAGPGKERKARAASPPLPAQTQKVQKSEAWPPSCCDSSSISFQIPSTALTPRPGSPQASPVTGYISISLITSSKTGKRPFISCRHGPQRPFDEEII